MPKTNSSDRYQIIKELGKNSAGGRVVYLAKDNYRKNLVVIKQFQFAKSNSSWSGFKAYENELKIMQLLNHKGIPRYLNSFPTARGFCLVQEYKPGKSLAELRSFDHEEIKQIIISILDILRYLQNQNSPIIHRDIKPENILIDNKNNVYLIDFGLAQTIGVEAKNKTESVAAGTFGFMAPEQIYNRRLSNATDLYGLGATLICLLAGIK
ncbi:serine/threonine-protein kinase [Okeania sp. SIO3B5]|uniref:serine/threonine protein kinase n=1 Tax=Okeania sp. SIO3B5 TaxID=2607811 RepID=UPI0025EE30F5|nr:serine/threonine-protein kinase [Okeania sp. SIO3B5]